MFLFLGGFILSIAIQKWRVHQRIGLGLMRYAAWNLPTLLAGLLLVTGFMGMWMSNTATAMVMMPMALSIAALTEGDTTSPVTKTLVLAVAYAPCIGGLATFIGTPTNAVLEGYVERNAHESESRAVDVLRRPRRRGTCCWAAGFSLISPCSAAPRRWPTCGR